MGPIRPQVIGPSPMSMGQMPTGIGPGQAASWFVQSAQQGQAFSGHPGHNYINETESSNQKDETR